MLCQGICKTINVLIQTFRVKDAHIEKGQKFSIYLMTQEKVKWYNINYKYLVDEWHSNLIFVKDEGSKKCKMYLSEGNGEKKNQKSIK